MVSDRRIVGQTIVPLTGGYYMAAALGVSQQWAYPIAGGILAAAVLANLAGMHTSGRVQIALAAGVALVLVVASLAAIGHTRGGRFTPFAPHGLSGIGRATVILFFAFAGWEAVAHLAGEFRDPQHDLRRASAITLVAVTVLYLGVATAVIATGTYGNTAVDHLAIGLLLHRSLGLGAVDAAAVAALIISLGTTSASVSRLTYALARDRWLPRPLAHISGREVPDAGIAFVGSIAAGGLFLAWAFGWGTQQLVYVPSTLVICVYLLATAAAAKLLTGAIRTVALAGVVLTACSVPFALQHLYVPAAVAALAAGSRRVVQRRVLNQSGAQAVRGDAP